LESNKYKILSATSCLALAVTFIFYLNTQVVLYADDFLYGTFFRDGLAGFLEQNIWHYQNFNGRVFVHLLVQIILIFDTAVFPFVNLGFLLSISFFSYRIQSSDREIHKLIMCSAFFLATFMLLDVSVLRESYMWISASFNYTFGLMMVVVLIFVYKKYTETGKLKWYMPIIAFLAGATTEQMGTTAFFAVCILAFAKSSDLKFVKSLPFIVPCIVGLATIFLSGATLTRLGRENLHILLTGVGRFNNISHVMYQANIGVIFSILGILLGLLSYFDKSISPSLKVGFVYAALTLVLQLMPFIPKSYLILSVLSVAFFVFAVVLLSKNKAYVFSATLILSALFSQFVMLFTYSHAPRTAYPAILLIIVVCADIMTKCKLRQVFTLPIYVIVCCLFFTPVIAGFRNNRIIMDENMSVINLSIERKEDIFFNIDFNESHRFSMAHDDGFIYQSFRNYHRIPSYLKIYFTSNENPPIYTADGVRLIMPVRYIENQVKMPFMLAVTALEGWYEWNFNPARIQIHIAEIADALNNIDEWGEQSQSQRHYIIHFNNTEYLLNDRTNSIRFYQNGEYHEYDLTNRNVKSLYALWYAEDIEKIFGITYEYQDGRYIISKR